MWIHRLIEKDPATMTGICQECGIVKLAVRRVKGKKDLLSCSIGRSEQRLANASGKAHERDRKYTPESGLIRRYGITLAERDQMILDQNGGCALCGKNLNELSKINVDHDHDTGKIRGILCSSCNMGLGLLGDNLEALKKATDYLSR